MGVGVTGRRGVVQRGHPVVVADGHLKAALFVGVVTLQHLVGSDDELRLYGRGRALRITGRNQVIYARRDLTDRDRITAAQRLASP